MPLPMLTQLQQSASSAALRGTWKMQAGRAMTLQPREAGIFRIAHGSMWITFDGPHGGPPNDQGDHVLGAGESIRIQAGQRVVAEAWGTQGASYFTWDPVSATVGSPSRRWAAVAQPLADLRLALAFGLGAAGRLVLGVVALAGDLVATRGRAGLADCALSAQSSACRAHGAIS